MNNKCLITQGCHNSGEPVTVVLEVKDIYETVKLHMTIKSNNEDGQTCYVKHYMTDT